MIVVILLSLFVLNYTVIVNQGSSLTVIAGSSPVDRQVITNYNNVWIQKNVTSQNTTEIPDHRRIYYNTATHMSQCNGSDIFDKLPNITSISYLTDGNTLDTTFWLSSLPLINHTLQDESEAASKIDQVFLYIEHDDISNYIHKEFDQLINDERKFIEEKRYPRVKVINHSSTKIDSNPVARIFFNGTINDTMNNPNLGQRNITALEEFTIKDKEIYRILYLAEPKDFDDEKYEQVIEHMISSFQILDASNIQTKNNNTLSQAMNINNTTASTEAFTSSSSSEQINNEEKFLTYTGKGMRIEYPSNWGLYHRSSSVLLFSPISEYLMGTGYIILIDVPSTYDTPTDFVAKVISWYKLNDRNWTKLIEEVSTEQPTRTLEQDPDFREFFNKTENWEAYAFIPINLRTINSPNQYLMVFLSEATYLKNGLLCELVQSTDQVSSPPPRITILPSSNSSSMGPQQEKRIEVTAKSFSNIPYTINFKNHYSEKVHATFNPSVIRIPAAGWNTSQLTVKAIWNPIPWNSPSVTETIPIVAQTNRSQLEEGNYVSFNTNVSISRPAAVSKIETSSLTITVFNWPDYIMNSLTSLSTPVSVFVTLAGLFGGIIAWFLKRETDKRSKIKKNSNSGNINNLEF
jgi:hypothetical protein